MQLIPVRSSCIAKLGFSIQRMEAHVLFRSGRLQTLREFPVRLWQDWMNASSHGSFYNRHVKGGKYRGRGKAA